MISYKFTNNVDMAANKDFTPVYKLDYTDTPFTVKSKGIELKRYLVTNNSDPDFTTLSNLTLVDTLTTNIIGFYSDDGAMMGFHYTDNFAFHYSGYFYADHSGKDSHYNFKVYGYGKIRVQVRSQWVIGAAGFSTLSPYAVNDDVGSNASGSTSLKAGNWYKIDVYYYSALGDSGFSLMWSNAFYGINRYIPVSAGICSKEAGLLTPTEVTDVISVESEHAKGDVSTLKFTVPLVISGSTDRGYYYNTYWDKYCHTVDNIALDKFKLVEFSAGYKIAGLENLIKKFCGHIETFQPVRGENNTIDITCNSFENLYKQTLNLNYPNVYDYWNADYAGDFVSNTRPDGNGCPVTFDGWELHQAVRVLSIRAGIDPYLFLKKKLHLNNSGVLVSGTWLIEETSPQSVMLDSNLNYGNAVVVNTTDVGSIADDEYILKSNFGDTLFDYMSTITDVYGWGWGTNAYYDGAPYLKSTNNPKEIKTAKTDTYKWGNYWTNAADLHTLGGVYYSTNNAGDYLQFTFSGVKVNLVIVGSSGTASGGAETTVVTTTDLVDITVADATGFTLGNVVVVETLLGEESAVIEGVVGNVISIEDALSSMPKKGGYFRLATFKVEIKRGATWETGTTVQTTYHSCYFKNGYDRLILPSNLSETSPAYLETNRYYYDGIDPKTSVNPTILNIANGLTYDTYCLRTTRLTNAEAGSTNFMRIDALMVYDNDTNQIVKTFYTGDSVVSGTITSLGVFDSGTDLRNDTIVVGRNLGVVTPGNSENNVLNPNNPTYEYIISRATDTASIYDPDAINYTGMPRQTIQIAPEIASYDRAKYWAVNFLNRYRYPAKYPEFEIIGHPLIEEGDCIAVYDEGKKTLNSFDKFWVTGISNTYEDKNYISQITTSSYEPWESYTPRLTPDIKDYGNVAVVNVKIKNGGDGISLIPVGQNGTGGGYYDPYSYDEKGTAIILQYDLVVDAYVKIDVYSQERNDILVATLLNPDGSNGVVGWMRQEPGKRYVVTWDGVDMFGDWNKYCTNSAADSIGKMYFSHEGLAPQASNGAGKFYFKFTILRRTDSGPSVLFSYDTKLQNIDNTGYAYIKRGNKGAILISSNPKSWFHRTSTRWNPVLNQYYDTDSVIPNVCFTDSQNYGSLPMNVKLSFSDITKDDTWRSWFGVTQSNTLDVFNSNRKIQIKVTVTPNVCVVGSWYVGTQYREDFNFKTLDPITIYDNQAFKCYQESPVERYFNMTQFGYTYDNYSYYLGRNSTNVIQENDGSIYMGIYLWVEIFAYDKSGRRLYTLVPNTLRSTGNAVANGFWLFWLDDYKPYPALIPGLPLDTGSNASGYKWSIFSGAKVKSILTDASGKNLFEYIYNWINPPGTDNDSYEDNISLVLVYPKKDYNSQDWGY